MKMIKEYRIFNLYKKLNILLESLLVTSDEFSNIIFDMANGSGTSTSGDPVAMILAAIIGTDIKTDHNYIGLSKRNDMVSSMTDRKAQEHLKDDIDPWTKSKNDMKVGRIVKSILDSNDIPISQSNIEQFVNVFKANFDRKSGATDTIRLIEGEEIRKWYDADSYVEGSGQLNNSCMRQKSKSSFLDIYVKNPDKVKMLIYTDTSDKLLARALVWKLDSGDTYVDRLYTVYDSDIKLVEDWMRNNLESYGSYYGDGGFRGNNLIVTIKKGDYKKYPYMDTFSYYDPVNGELASRKSDLNNNDIIYNIQSTNGSYDEIYNINVYSRWEGGNIPREYAVLSDSYGWLLRSESINVIIEDSGITDWFPIESQGDVFDEDVESGYYYIMDLLEEFGTGYVYKGNIIDVYEANDDLLYTAVDAYLFDVKIDLDSPIRVDKRDYLRDLYKSMIYKYELERLSELVGSKEKEVIKIKEKEVIDQNIYFYNLSNTGIHANIKYYYDAIQIVYSFGGYEKFLKAVRKEFIFDYDVASDYIESNDIRFKTNGDPLTVDYFKYLFDKYVDTFISKNAGVRNKKVSYLYTLKHTDISEYLGILLVGYLLDMYIPDDLILGLRWYTPLGDNDYKYLHKQYREYKNVLK